MQASVGAVETRDVPTAGAAPAALDERPEDGTPPPSLAAFHRAGRDSPSASGFIAAVALDQPLSNDEFWSLAAGQWMLAHHRIIGLDPFSYTEAHRRWVTDEWGSEVALASLYRAFGAAAFDIYGIVLGGLCLLASVGVRPRPRRSRWPGGGHRLVAVGRHRRSVVVADRGLDFSLVWFPWSCWCWPRRGPTHAGSSCSRCCAWRGSTPTGRSSRACSSSALELVWSVVPARRVGAGPRRAAVAATPVPWSSP